MAKKKSKLLGKIILWVLPIVVTIFLVTLFAIFWSFILANKWIVLGISGGFIILAIALGYFNRRKFFKSLKRRLS